MPATWQFEEETEPKTWEFEEPSAPETPEEAVSKKSSRLGLELEAARHEVGPVTEALIRDVGISPTPSQAAALASPIGLPLRPYTPQPRPPVAEAVYQAGRTVAEMPTAMTAPTMLPLLPLAALPLPGGPVVRHAIPKAMGILFGGQSLGHGAADIVTGIEQEDPGLVGRGAGEVFIGGTMAAPVVGGAIRLPRSLEAALEEPAIEAPSIEPLQPFLPARVQPGVRAGIPIPTEGEMMSRPGLPTQPKPPPVVLPETLPEARETVIESIRRADARTIGQIQALFPEAQLSREQARVFRNIAFPPIVEPVRPQATVADIIGKQPPEPPPEPGGATVPKPPPGPVIGGPSAVIDTPSAKIYEPLPSSAREGAGQMPIEESGVRVSPPEKAVTEVSLTDAVGNAPEFYSLPRLRALERNADPRVAAAKKYYGAKTIPDLARLAKARFEEMAKARTNIREPEPYQPPKPPAEPPLTPEEQAAAQRQLEEEVPAAEKAAKPPEAPKQPETVADAWDKFNEGDELSTAKDLADTIERLIDEGKAPKSLNRPLNKYRRAMEEDFREFGGRGDVEPIEEAFLDAVEKAASKPVKKPAKPPEPAVAPAEAPAIAGEFIADYQHPISSHEWRIANAVPEDWKVILLEGKAWVAESPVENGGKMVKTVDSQGRGKTLGVSAPATPPPVAEAKAQAEVTRVAQTEGKRSAKEIKAELVSRLEQAVKDAPTEYDAVSAAVKKAGATVETKADKFEAQKKAVYGGKQVPQVTIEIPGDGTFRVWNTKEALGLVLTRAKRLATTGTEGPHVTRRSAPKLSPEELSAMSVEPPQEPPAPGPGAASPSGFFPQRSEAHGLGEPSMPPTVEDVRRQRLLDREGTPVPPEPEQPTPPPAGPPETTLDLPGDAEIANAIRRQDVMPGRDWLASPEFEFRKNPIGAELTTKAVEAELRYQAEAGRDYERFDKLKADLTKEQQIRITKALRAAQEGDRTGLARLTDQERGVATEIRKYFDEVKQVIIDTKKNDLIESMPDARGNAVRDILAGTPEADAFRTHRLRATGQRAVRDALAELERLNNWGPQDYVTNIERGSFRIVDPSGKTVAIAETRTAAKEKALAYSREHPDVRRLTITDEFATNVEFPTKLSRGQYFRMANRAANALGTDVREIQRMLRAEGSPVVIVKPASKFSGPLQRRYDVLKGEENLFDALPAYSYSIRKKLALDPVFKEARTDLAKLPERMQSQVYDLLEDIRGRYSLADQITDYILSPLGQKPFMFSRGVNQARKITTALKLGYRPTTAIINRLGGAQHTWVKTGTKYWLEGRRFSKTPEFRELWKENADYVGASAQAFLEGGHTAVDPWYKPLGMFQRAELKNRPEAFASFYKYAEGELGLTGADAAAFARKASRFAQFTYTVGSLPRLLRNPVGRLVGQFKPYLVKEMEFISSLRGYEIPRYLTSFLAMGGPRAGIFMLRSLPILGAIGALWSIEDWLNRKAPRASRGLPGYAGVDVTAAVTPQLPSRATDWMGPTISDMWHLWDDVIRPAMQGEHKDFSDIKDWGARISPAALYWSRLVEAVMSREGWITDARGRPEYKPGTGGKVALAIGAKPLEQAVKEVDRAYLRHVDEIARKNREHVIDRILVALDKGDGATLSKLMQEAAEYGVDINAIKNAAKQKAREPDERLRRQLLKSTRAIEAERAAP